MHRQNLNLKLAHLLDIVLGPEDATADAGDPTLFVKSNIVYGVNMLDILIKYNPS